MEKTLLEQLNDKLKAGIVEFKFTKKDGTERVAKGTKVMDIIDTLGGCAPKGTGSEKTGVTAYWDLDREGWRSFQNDSLVEIIG